MIRRSLARAAAFAAALALLAGGSAAAAAPQKVAGGIRFTYVDANAKSVYWAGDFNNWSASAAPLVKDANGTWSIVVALPPGRQHAYKFVVDGQWFADPENPVTVGNEGNSVIELDAEGGFVAQNPTSNTPYSAKIFVNGRVIGLYQAEHNDATGRYEIVAPNLDMDLGFRTRVSDVLSADWLMNMQSKPNDTEQWRSELNFDRGSLDFTKPHLRIFAYDNRDAGTWDDPLHLVGDIGIYHYGFGFKRQGFRANSDWLGFDTEVQYADNFAAGGTSFANIPTIPTDTVVVVRSGSGWALQSGFAANNSTINFSDAGENVSAARIRRTLPGGLRVGALGRWDRGFNLGATNVIRVTGPAALQQAAGQFETQWYAGGGEAQWSGRGPLGGIQVFGEYLRGIERMSFVNGVVIDVTGGSVDSLGTVRAAAVQAQNAAGRHLDLDESNRMRAGATWTETHGDIVVRFDVERQDHDYKLVPNRPFGFENSMTTMRFGWDRNWRYYLGRELKSSLEVERTAFDYDSATPWDYQLWLPSGNFWLEGGEHVVSFDRLTMLGGTDAVRIRPRLELPIGDLRVPGIGWGPRNTTFEYRGTYDATTLGREPKYSESLFLFGLDVAPRLRLSSDSRWAVYHDPVLQVDAGYLDHFVQLAYEFAPGIRIAVSGGVEPVVLDDARNEYAYIGRDLFLFGHGANASEATINYFGLGAKIQSAEAALAHERRVQVRADVRF